MILFGVPLSIKTLHKEIGVFISSLIHFPWRLKTFKKNMCFVYFSYQPDFDYLVLSLKSLVANVKSVKRVYVFMDQKKPFSEDEMATLRSIYPEIRFNPVYGFSWASIETTLAELNSFTQVAQECEPDDFVVKVDSDILFLRSDKLARISGSKSQVVGDTRFVDYQFMQGGLYLMRARVVNAHLAQVSVADVEDILKRNGHCLGEDCCVTWRLRDCHIPITDTRLMIFPDEYRKLPLLNRFVSWDFAALHFVSDKQAMRERFAQVVDE